MLAGLETAPGHVVGEVQRVTALPHAGYLASLSVTRVMVGDLALAQSTIEVVWEEPAPSLPPRLVSGGFVLVGVEPLPTASIWRVRVPDAERRAGLLALAGRGQAYLVRPSQSELAALEHYLALSSQARHGDAGVIHLSSMAATSQPRLALPCLARLRGLVAFSREEPLVAASRSLVAALLRGAAEASKAQDEERRVGRAALALIEDRRPSPRRPAISAGIARRGDDVPAILYAAVGVLDGSLPDALALELLSSSSKQRRLAAARFASGAKARLRLRELLHADRDADVRAAAVGRLLELESQVALPDAIRAFDDPAPEVRSRAARSVAALGDGVLSELRYVSESGSRRAAQTAIATLSMMGQEAHALLAELAKELPDEGLRALAGIAVGLPIGERH